MTDPDRARRLTSRVRNGFRDLRARRPAVDHAVRAYDRNSEVLGSQIAGALTYFGFLSLFPVLALVFAAVGYVSAIYPDAQQAVIDAVTEAFPSLIGSGKGQLNLDDVINSRAGAGVFGVLGLLYAGTGWIDSLRDGIRRVFGTLSVQIGFLRRKLLDVLVLVLLGSALLVSLAVTSVATAATTYVLDLLDLERTTAALGLLKLLSVALALAADTLLFAIVLSRLSGVRLPWTRVRSGALLAAVGFELLKLVATFLIARVTDNPLYATFGVVVGLLVWINVVSRLMIYAAAWTATQPYSLEPGELGDQGAGRSTVLAAETEPVSVVAPRDFEPVPAGAVEASRPCHRWRSAAVAGAAGAALTVVVQRQWANRR